ncbi:MAG TPA: PorV/PorQ family protein [bacterium]|nr:PorV/PorQ family protein [bacterium]HPG46801.1 PorV/PorQ family protein [bacterium]HPM98869.1 PorV/PorQ family protein [bacterium]
MLQRIVLILLLSMLVTAYGQYERPGSTDAQFLKIETSPRAAAMGGAYISVVEGAEAAYYNPAALAWIPRMDLAFTHTEWFADIRHDYVAGAYTVNDLVGTFAVSITALYTDEMFVTTPLQPDGTGESFYAGNYRIGLAYSRFLTDRVSIGGSINTIHLSLYSDFTASAVTADIAVLYRTDYRGFRFGMKIANFGSEIKFVNESYPPPTNFTFGMSMNALQLPNQQLLVSVNAIKPNDGVPIGLLGMEWALKELLFLRGGYNLNHEIAKFTFGGGIQVPVVGSQARFDYSYSDYSLLGGAHRVGIGLSF